LVGTGRGVRQFGDDDAAHRFILAGSGVVYTFNRSFP
jgi:hypothetical protein